jgi:hypothetical protein
MRIGFDNQMSNGKIENKSLIKILKIKCIAIKKTIT